MDPFCSETFAQAVLMHRRGDLDQAAALCRRVVAFDPNFADAHLMLGVVAGSLGAHAEAVASLERATALLPGRADVRINLGEALRRAGQLQRAVTALREAVTLNPTIPEAHFNLANTLKQAGEIDSAAAHFTRAIELRPGYAKAHFNLGNLHREQCRFRSAMTSYENALAAEPDRVDALLGRADMRLEFDELDAALAGYQRVAALQPRHPTVDASLGGVFAKLGRIEEARSALSRHAAKAPGDPLREFQAAVCEPVLPDAAAAEAFAAGLERTLEGLLAHPRPVEPGCLHTSAIHPPMELAYHGPDHRSLRTKHAAWLASLLPVPEPLEFRNAKPKIGIVVTRGHEGVFIKCLLGIVNRLDMPEAELLLVVHPLGEKILRPLLTNASVTLLAIPHELPAAARMLREARFDLLHFWEMGTDSTNFVLPYFRPARIISTTWGWPVSSHAKCVDHYVSAAPLETPGADADYSERLIRLPSLPTYYLRPPIPKTPRERAHFGLNGAQRMYVCAQNLRKFHPDFDGLIAGILDADPEGVFVYVGSAQAANSRKVEERLRRTLPPALLPRVKALPWLPEAEYLNLLAVSDVVLDPRPYGCGANTAFDALAAGKPIVTWPTERQRGRWAMAALAKLGIEETVAGSADEYVRIAVQLGRERDRREEICRRIRDRSDALFEDLRAVRDLESYFRETVAINE